MKHKILGEIRLKSYEGGQSNKGNTGLGEKNETNVLYQNQKGIKRLCQRKQKCYGGRLEEKVP